MFFNPIFHPSGMNQPIIDVSLVSLPYVSPARDLSSQKIVLSRPAAAAVMSRRGKLAAVEPGVRRGSSQRWTRLICESVQSHES